MKILQSCRKRKEEFCGYRANAGKKLGVIGLGAIGVKVANTARHFGMEVYGYDPYLSVNAAWNLSRDVKHVTECGRNLQNVILLPYMYLF